MIWDKIKIKMFIIQKRTSENEGSSLLKKDYPCSLIRMHLIATSEDSIFQKEDFGWGLLFNVGVYSRKLQKQDFSYYLPGAIKQIW